MKKSFISIKDAINAIRGKFSEDVKKEEEEKKEQMEDAPADTVEEKKEDDAVTALASRVDAIEANLATITEKLDKLLTVSESVVEEMGAVADAQDTQRAQLSEILKKEPSSITRELFSDEGKKMDKFEAIAKSLKNINGKKLVQD